MLFLVGFELERKKMADWLDWFMNSDNEVEYSFLNWLQWSELCERLRRKCCGCELEDEMVFVGVC